MRSRLLVIPLALSFVAAGGPQAVKTDLARATTMHTNFREVNLIQTAVIRGDLDAMRAPARRLAEMPVPAGLPDMATKHANAMSRFARDAEMAATPAAAALATGQMLTTCGTCHLALGTRPAIASAGWPSVGGTVGHMQEHQRAIDQMMRGLVLPSTSEWLTGSRALRASPLHARELPRDAKLTPALLRVEEAVHRLAEDAVAAETPAARTRVYSTLLARCADCHSLHKKIWGPGALN